MGPLFIAHALEESYIASTRSQCKLSLFLAFSWMSHSRVCLCSKVARSVTQHYDKSTDYSSCTCTHLCPVGILKHEVWLSSLLYISFLLVHTIGLLADQSFTNMGQIMRWWLHWKYHFMWSSPCTISVRVGVVFAFSQFACVLVFLLTLFFCFSSYLLCFRFCFFSWFSLLFISSLVSFSLLVSFVG